MVEVTKYTVFLDEAGNTGGNYTDPNQPFYLVGGWIVESHHIDEFSAYVNDWEQANFKGKEVKASAVLKSAQGIKRLVELIQTLGKIASPTHSVFEKRFGICARFLESCLDATYNPQFSQDLVEDVDAKYNFADDLYQIVPLEDLNRFSEAVGSRNKDNIEIELKFLASTIRKSSLQKLSQLVDATPIQNAVDYLTCADNLQSSINVTCFFSIVSLLEGFFRQINAGQWNLIHDQTASMESHLLDTGKLLQIGLADYCIKEFATPVPAGNYRVNEITFADSSKTPAIRAADYYVGLASFLLKNRISLLENKNDETRTACLLTFGGLLRKQMPTVKFPPLFHEVLSAKVCSEMIQGLTA